MRQEDVLITLRTGGRMTVPEIVEALALDVSTNTESMVRSKLRRLRDKRLVRPVRIEERSNRVQWEAVQ